MCAQWAITGGSGYVGRSLTRALLSRAESVRILTRQSRAFAGGVEVVRGDILDPEALRLLVRGADVVVHLAGYVHRAVRTAEEHRRCFEVNVTGAETLLAAVRTQAPSAFVIDVSSASVYGEMPQPAVESDACHPVTLYGRSKLEAERLFLEAGSAGLPVAILRPAMVLGPGAPGNFERLVKLVRTGVFPEVGPSPMKSLVPIDDLTMAILAVAGQMSRCAGSTFNVGAGGEVLTMRQISQEIAATLGSELRYLPLPKALVGLGARVADMTAERLRLRVPSIMQMLETFISPAVIDDSRIRGVTGLHSSAGVRATIAETVRATMNGSCR